MIEYRKYEDEMNDNEKIPRELIEEIQFLRQKIGNLERQLNSRFYGSSDSTYQELVELLPETIWESDLQGNFQFVSKRGFELFGYTTEDFLEGVSIFNVIAPDDWNKVKENIKKIVKGENIGVQEYTMMRKDGSTFPAYIHTNRILHDTKPVGLRGILIDVTDRKNAEKALRESEKKYETLVEKGNDGIIVIQEGILVFVNSKMVEMIEYNKEELLGKSFSDFIALSFMSIVAERYKRRLSGEKVPENHYIELITKSGSTLHVEANGSLIEYDNKIVDLVIVRNITERKRLENQLLQAQKMESIGRLAGGIAHDFNNMLTAIMGNAELALMSMSQDNPIYNDIIEIKTTTERAANLTRQLLAFSRRQIIEPRVLNLNEVILDMNKMLRRLIGENIELVTIPHESLWLVKIDPSQIEQVLTNIIINARDAMPGGGKLIIETANVMLDEEYAESHPDIVIGNYVLLAISDTGVGMDTETLTQIFEPFFTTKEKGKGTGLGLATCYGIIKQNDGYINAYSELGHGTTFKIYLPAVPEGTQETNTTSIDTNQLRGTETILVVEDEPSVRQVITRNLSKYGYSVLETANGEDALRLVDEFKSAIQLILTDVVMPRMGGKALVERLKKKLPNIKVLFMSGYTDNSIVHLGIVDPGIEFIQKPFYSGDLLKKVRYVLDNKGV